MSSDPSTHEALVKDIYQIGLNLKDHKYRYLSLSYRCFLIGIIATAILFIVQTILFFFT